MRLSQNQAFFVALQTAAIQSIDAETIERSGAQVNVSESLVRIPGITILNRQNYAQDLQLAIRGFGA